MQDDEAYEYERREERQRREAERHKEVQAKLRDVYDWDKLPHHTSTGYREPWPLPFITPDGWEGNSPKYTTTWRRWELHVNVDRVYINELHQMILDLREELQELREELAGE